MASVLPIHQRASVPQDDSQKSLVEAKKLLDAGEPDDAWLIVKTYLRDVDVDDYRYLILATQIMEKCRRLVEAYHFARRAADLNPTKAGVWMNLGRVQETLFRFEDAERTTRKALSLAAHEGQKLSIINNLSSLLISSGNFVEAEKYAREALLIDPDYRKAQANLGTALLAQGKWEEGWPLYDQIIGYGDERKLNQYASEPVWDGSKGKRLVIYGEQGLGDEISFSSMIPDAIRDSQKVILDCDKKLEGLFRRSFPQARVYGTRWQKDEVPWHQADRNFDASISVGALGKFYRPTPESCPGTAYLVPDPDRVAMWKGLFATKGKPVIGIAWTGGVQWTGAKNRKWKLDELLPIFRAVNAHWVCLQYTDAEEELRAFRMAHPDVDIQQYPYGTLTKDYDDTAALVAALDQVVCMQTAVVHLCGALGVPVRCFVNRHGQWRYGVSGDSLPWYRSVRLYRQEKDGRWPIAEAAHDLEMSLKWN